MASDPLAQQIAAEAAAIQSAPAITVETGTVGRCSFCGRIAQHLQPFHDYSSNGGTVLHERYKGECCNGGLNG